MARAQASSSTAAATELTEDVSALPFSCSIASEQPSIDIFSPAAKRPPTAKLDHLRSKLGASRSSTHLSAWQRCTPARALINENEKLL